MSELQILMYIAYLVFFAGIIYTAVKMSRMPVHLRWDLYPIPHEKGREHFNFMVNVCLHCDDPPCLEACPEEAISKREDGIVTLDEALCSGCQLCLDACPYSAISFDGTVAHKCNLCSERIDHGLVPACADNVCLAHCIYFGSPEDVEQQKRKRLGHG